MHIIDLTLDNTEGIEQAASILIAAFREHWPDAWPDIESALEEVRESFGEDRISCILRGNEAVRLAGGVVGVPAI